jgi:hypothetical protein
VKILEYIGLDTSSVKAQFHEVRTAIARDDFRSAEVKKLAGHGRFYRAKLDYANRLPPPLIVVGSAGSGKTALTLEKMKHVEGEVLYVTHSAYLAQSARDLYFGHGFERHGQEATFLSYREFVETLRVAPGREATWRDFAAWFARQQQAFRGIDAHQAFEEIRGVIAADAGGVLDRGQYRALGVRQSIFAESERDRLYDLFEKYRAWLDDARLYDLNLVAHAWRRATISSSSTRRRISPTRSLR